MAWGLSLIDGTGHLRLWNLTKTYHLLGYFGTRGLVFELWGLFSLVNEGHVGVKTLGRYWGFDALILAFWTIPVLLVEDKGVKTACFANYGLVFFGAVRGLRLVARKLSGVYGVGTRIWVAVVLLSEIASVFVVSGAHDLTVAEVTLLRYAHFAGCAEAH